MLLGVDVGTTNCKAGLFRLDGTVVKITTSPTLARRAPEGYSYYDPEELWETVAVTIRQALAATGEQRIAACGISSMAESGLLVDCKTGSARSFVVPWFDNNAESQSDFIRRYSDALERFCKTGIRATFKCSVAKLMWLISREPGVAQNSIWLSAADYIAFRLTGQMGTDYTLAGRTFAFRIDTKQWDGEWLDSLALSARLFPEARPSGVPVGTVQGQDFGPLKGVPIAVAGHDHVCAALAVGAIEPGRVLNSMGTAESLLGAMEERSLGEEELKSGLVFGCHVVAGLNYWMGGLSSSGGSVEWLRSILNDPPLSYAGLQALLLQAKDAPTGILFYPYLLGNVPGRQGQAASACFIGLKDSHRRSDLLKAVLEGTSYEMETLRRSAQAIVGFNIDRITCAGGGTRLRPWLQIKADVSGSTLILSPVSEATLLGAAMTAGIGGGTYTSAEEAVAATAWTGPEVVAPDRERHRLYKALYETEYLTFQENILGVRTCGLTRGSYE